MNEPPEAPADFPVNPDGHKSFRVPVSPSRAEAIERQLQSPEHIARMAEMAAADEKERTALYRAAKLKAVEALNIPVKDRDLIRMGGLLDTEAVRLLRDPPVLAVISGGAGCGKTTAASAWLFEYVMADENWRVGSAGARLIGRPPLFVTAAKLTRVSRYKEDAVEKVQQASRLVIDDLGAEYQDDKGFFASTIDEIINERYAGRLMTVMTTNLKAEDFTERYGERIRDRIREVGKFLSIKSGSMRKQTVNEETKK